jgi:hypothetical protein
VFITRQVLEGAEPILHVTHDSDDHGWQFFGREAREEDAKIIALHSYTLLRPPTLDTSQSILLRGHRFSRFCVAFDLFQRRPNVCRVRLLW